MSSRGIFRTIQVTTWTDVWFSELDVDEKLLFIFLFTNRESNMLGLYEISVKSMSFHTGISVQRIEEILAKFADNNKVYYSHADSMVWVRNMRKLQETRSPKVQQHIRESLYNISECSLKNQYIKYYGDQLAPPMKSIGYKVMQPEENRFEQLQAAEDMADACEVFATVTGQMTFQSKTQAEDIRRINTIISRLGKEKSKSYLKEYFDAWSKRKGKDGRPYSKMNTGWLDWAVAGDIPDAYQPASIESKIGPYLGS